MVILAKNYFFWYLVFEINTNICYIYFVIKKGDKMKKLLGILSILSLATISASTTISCGLKGNENNGHIDDNENVNDIGNGEDTDSGSGIDDNDDDDTDNGEDNENIEDGEDTEDNENTEDGEDIEDNENTEDGEDTDNENTNDGADDFEKAVEDFQDKGSESLLNGDSEATWIDAGDLGYEVNDYYKMFELYNKQIRVAKLDDFYSSDEFKNIIQDLKGDFFSDFTNVSIDLSNMNLVGEEVLAKYQPQNLPDVFFKNTEANVLETKHAVLREIHEDGSDITFKSGVQKVNNQIFDYLDQNISQMYNDFETNFSQKLQGKDYRGNYAKIDNFLMGEATLGGIKITTDKFITTINDFKINYIFSLSGEELLPSTNLVNSYLGEAIYKNIIAGISSFQSNLGVEAPKITTSYEIPLAFSGINQQTGLDLWQDIKDNAFYSVVSSNGDECWTYSNDNYPKLGSILSLTISGANESRQELLKIGYQGNYSLELCSFDSSGTFIFRENLAIKFSTIFVENGLEKSGWEVPNDQNPYEYAGLQIQFNFMNIAFGFEEFSNNANAIGKYFMNNTRI
ncbi:hypothetical protein SCLAR_v1c04510 [Spiroplasma clarkii]|uniref:Uncharacterized protein n=2 Tax=Spiroplasma clarkii TaxID=2139 RepID=A0A2K8KGG7_9MOLU|nr:hypothetical protein SCLAR_v1c04510 [Spiroplasma clarkii]